MYLTLFTYLPQVLQALTCKNFSIIDAHPWPAQLLAGYKREREHEAKAAAQEQGRREQGQQEQGQQRQGQVGGADVVEQGQGQQGQGQQGGKKRRERKEARTAMNR